MPSAPDEETLIAAHNARLAALMAADPDALAGVLVASVGEVDVVELDASDRALREGDGRLRIGHLGRMGGVGREVRLVDGDVTLSGVAEAVGRDRWLVGVAGVTDDACIVIRMTAEQEGTILRGWAVVDTEGQASSLPFVAEPTSCRAVLGHRSRPGP